MKRIIDKLKKGFERYIELCSMSSLGTEADLYHINSKTIKR